LDTEDVQSAKEMLKYLYADYTFLIGQLRKDITLAESLGDLGTVDMCVQMVRQYEKAAWFLKSHGF
jgi:DNA-binding ferritin-like protein